MALEIEPPELAAIVDFAERPRVHGWSLRAALVRYAQPEAERAGRLLEAVRRTDRAVHVHDRELAKHGPRLWASLAGDDDAPVLRALRVAQRLDVLGDVAAAWAVDVSAPRPNSQIDTTTAEVTAALDEMGIPREEGPPRPAARGV